jgi:hypothetical protein
MIRVIRLDDGSRILIHALASSRRTEGFPVLVVTEAGRWRCVMFVKKTGEFREYPLLPPGWYKARLVDLRQGPGSRGG